MERPLQLDAGVVVDHVKAAELVLRTRDRFGNVALDRDVAGVRRAPSAGGSDFVGHALGAVGVLVKTTTLALSGHGEYDLTT